MSAWLGDTPADILIFLLGFFIRRVISSDMLPVFIISAGGNGFYFNLITYHYIFFRELLLSAAHEDSQFRGLTSASGAVDLDISCICQLP